MTTNPFLDQEQFGTPCGDYGCEAVREPREAVYSEPPRFTYTERRDDSKAYPRWFQTWRDGESGEEITVEATGEGRRELAEWRADLERHRS